MINKNRFKAKFLKIISHKVSNKFNITGTSKVLMFRYDRIGDMVITTPVFRELKLAYPNIEISVLASKANHMILKNNPYVDNIYLNNKNNIFLDLFVLLRLRIKNFDVCFEFDHSVIRHAILRLKIINPKKVISVEKYGRYGLKGSELKIYNFYTPKPKNTHFRDIWLATLIPFNVVPKSKKYDIFFDKTQKNKALDFLHKYPNKILIGINLEGAVQGKKIHYNQLKEICKGIYNLDKKIQIIILCSPNNDERVEKDVFNMGLSYVTKSYKTKNILDASALISYLNIVITPDTSIAHIASTFNKPVITIHENNHESHKLFAPTSDIHRTIFSKNFNSLDDFSVKSVLDAANELITIFKDE
ncbi:lipopolysaccharide heptosyltransferase family protein [Candidatus Thioglobus sp.]|nr:lipopolysaccharide heptosyltransferase family protein [Candidatus Thioglobus sp.]